MLEPMARALFLNQTTLYTMKTVHSEEYICIISIGSKFTDCSIKQISSLVFLLFHKFLYIGKDNLECYPINHISDHLP